MNEQDKAAFEAAFEDVNGDWIVDRRDFRAGWQAAMSYRQNEIAELEHEIRLVRARNERLEREAGERK